MHFAHVSGRRRGKILNGQSCFHATSSASPRVHKSRGTKLDSRFVNANLKTRVEGYGLLSGSYEQTLAPSEPERRCGDRCVSVCVSVCVCVRVSVCASVCATFLVVRTGETLRTDRWREVMNFSESKRLTPDLPPHFPLKVSLLCCTLVSRLCECDPLRSFPIQLSRTHSSAAARSRVYLVASDPHSISEFGTK